MIKHFEKGAVPNNCTVEELINYLLIIEDKNAIVCRVVADDVSSYSSIESVEILNNIQYTNEVGDIITGNVLAIY
jgi:hypothetical protein